MPRSFSQSPVELMWRVVILLQSTYQRALLGMAIALPILAVVVAYWFARPNTAPGLVRELFRTADVHPDDRLLLVERDEEPLSPAVPKTVLNLLSVTGPKTIDQAIGKYELADKRHYLRWSIRYHTSADAVTAASSLAKRCGEIGFPSGAVTTSIQDGGTSEARMHSERKRRYMLEAIDALTISSDSDHRGNHRGTVTVQWSLSCEAAADDPSITPVDLANISPRLGGIRLKDGDQVLYEAVKHEPIFMSVLNLCPRRKPASWWEVRVLPELREPFEAQVESLGFHVTARFNDGDQIFWEREGDNIRAAVIGHPDGKSIRLRCVPRR